MQPLGIAPRNFHAPLLQTGQTTQYGGYPDDGYYQKGISKSYTVLTTGQYAGTTAITINSKTDTHSNNCVFDNRTRLMWSRYVSASVGPTSNGLLPWTTNANGEGIFAYVAVANAASLSGYADWKIPNIFELFSLAKYEVPNSVPNSVAFPSFPTSIVWVSTTVTTGTTYATRVNFANGLSGQNLKTENYYCLLVRG